MAVSTHSGHRTRRRVTLIVILAVAALLVVGIGGAVTVGQVTHVMYVPSAAMEPTFPTGSRVIVVRTPDDGPKAADVIIHTKPEDPATSFIKRVVAVGPATVAFADGRVLVNGQPLDEPYLPSGSQTRGAPADLGTPCPPAEPCTVGEGELYVLGDNRENSQDSRYDGPVRRDAVEGVVSRKLFG